MNNLDRIQEAAIGSPHMVRTDCEVLELYFPHSIAIVAPPADGDPLWTAFISDGTFSCLIEGSFTEVMDEICATERGLS